MLELIVGGEKIFYRTAGHATGESTLVFIHGAGGSSYTWNRQLERLPTGHRYVALDLPGHSQSQGKGKDTIQNYVDFLGSFLKALNSGPYVLVGHSMGGAIVQLYALGKPAGLKAIILVGTGARLRVAPMVFEALKGDFTSAIELSTGWSFSEKTPSSVIQPFIQEMLKGSAEVQINDFRACDAFDVMARVQEIALPTLIVCGADDRLTPPKYSQYLHDKIPASTLEIIPDAGHMVMLEKHREFSAALQKFIENPGNCA